MIRDPRTDRTGNDLSHRWISRPIPYELIATLCAGLFAGAAIYINVVEHPARMECGTNLAFKEFGPSYRRATVMQASLAALGFLAGLAACRRDGSAAQPMGSSARSSQCPERDRLRVARLPSHVPSSSLMA